LYQAINTKAMTRNSFSLIPFSLLLVGLLFPALLSAQYVYTRAYRHQVQPLALDVVGNNLVTVGTVGGQAFGYTIMDTTGQLTRALAYHNPQFKSEQLHFVHRYLNGDRILAGMGRTQLLSGDSTKLVVMRVRPNGIPVWSRSYSWASGLGGIMTGLDVGPDSAIYVAAQMYQPNVSDPMVGLVARLDTAGQIVWSRQIGLAAPGTGVIPPRVKHNITVNQNGELICGWNLAGVSPTIPSFAKGFTIRAYDGATGLLNWEKQYQAARLMTLNLTPGDNGLALYVRDVNQQKTLVKLDANGDEIYSILDAYQQNTDRPTRIKPVGNRIPFLHGNRMTFWLSPFAVANPILKGTGGANRVITDFQQFNGNVYYAGYRKTTHGNVPYIGKAQVSPLVANCFLEYETSNNYSFNSLDTMDVNPVPLLMQIFDSDTLVLVKKLLNSTSKVQCIGQGLVWPGDANSDGVANVVDILFLGLAWNKTGPARATQSIQWQGWPALDWNSDFFNGANKKHADCNGNGHVGFADLLAILVNYGLTHNKGDDNNGSETDPPFLLQILNDSVSTGDTVHAEILLGSKDIPVKDLHGLAFSIEYNSALVDSASFRFIPANSWLGTDSVDLATIQKDLPANGLFHAAMTRTDQTDVSGYGLVGKVTFVTIDDIAGKNFSAEKLMLKLSKMDAINVNQEEVDFFACSDSVVVVQKESSTAIEPDELLTGVQVYPNPAQDQLFIRSQTVLTETISLMDLQGRILRQESLHARDAEISLAPLPQGVYLLRGESKEGIWMEKVIIQ
jgi:hypothetical protein